MTKTILRPVPIVTSSATLLDPFRDGLRVTQIWPRTMIRRVQRTGYKVATYNMRGLLGFVIDTLDGLDENRRLITRTLTSVTVRLEDHLTHLKIKGLDYGNVYLYVKNDAILRDGVIGNSVNYRAHGNSLRLALLGVSIIRRRTLVFPYSTSNGFTPQRAIGV